MKLFWQQQQKNSPRSVNGRRYHPMIIRWCLSIACKSSSAYDELRGTFNGSGIIELPSQRQLRNYSNAIKPRTGFNPEIVDTLANMVKPYKSFERYVSVLFDEMKVQSGLVWDKHSGELIGYVDLGDPDINYATLHAEDHIATHALVFMVQGICSKLQFVIGYFATEAITSIQLFSLFWRAVAICEISCELAVVVATADGASPNRRFIKMHGEMDAENERDLVYKAPNIHAENRNIFFFSDAPHLVKTSRNCLFHSGSGRHTRYMWNNGQDMLWSHISSIYYKDQENGLHLLPKLTADHILLNSYSVMRVDLAAQVLSKTMATVLREFSSTDALATAQFCEMIDSFFDCFNVRSLKEGEYQRKEFLKPYTDVDDQRFQWLEEEFLGYLQSWRDSIDAREGEYDGSARSKMFIAWQTYEGLKLITYSLIDVTKLLLRSGARYILTNRFCQDPVEEYFRRQRGLGRRCDNPSIRDFGSNANKLRIQRSILPVR